MQKLEDWEVNSLKELYTWCSENMEKGKFPQYLRTAVRILKEVIQDNGGTIEIQTNRGLSR